MAVQGIFCLTMRYQAYHFFPDKIVNTRHEQLY